MLFTGPFCLTAIKPIKKPKIGAFKVIGVVIIVKTEIVKVSEKIPSVQLGVTISKIQSESRNLLIPTQK